MLNRVYKTRGRPAEMSKKTPKAVTKSTNKMLKMPIFNKKLRVPKLSRFRIMLGLGILGLIVLLGFPIYSMTVLPKATIVISGDTETLHKTLEVSFDTAADTVDTEKLIVPSVVEQVEHTSTKTVATTGKHNGGGRAKGSVFVKACYTNGSNPDPSINAELNGALIPKGTVFTVDINGNKLEFIAAEADRLDYGRDTCQVNAPPNVVQIHDFWQLHARVPVIAREGGTKYNTKITEFSYYNYSPKSVLRTSGGTDKYIPVVSQKDIDGLKNPYGYILADSTKAELRKRLEGRGLFAVVDSAAATSVTSVTTSAKVSQVVKEITGTGKTTVRMVGVKRADLEALITKVMEQDIDTSKQKIIKTGLDEAVFKLKNQKDGSTKVMVSIDVTSVAGPKLDEEAVKNDIAGMKAVEVEQLIGRFPTVTDVEVYFEPFWLSAIPRNPSKITIRYANE